MKIFDRDYKPDYEISSGQRLINSDGSKYDFLFPQAAVKDTIVMDNGEVSDTLQVIENVVRGSLDHTVKVAELLKQQSLESTLRSIWEFLYYNIQYKLDKEGMEELRKPSRAWHDRYTGIDCDCFSIFCSSILCNLGIPHRFRITRYSKPHWQHIYVIVPNAGNRYYTVDAVLSQFNYEKPYTQKMDYTMPLNGIKIAVLSGTEDISPAVKDTGRIVMNSMQLAAAHNVALHAAIFGVDLQGLGIMAGEEYLAGTVKDAQIEKGLYRYLVATRQAVAENPVTSFVAGYNHEEIIKMLDYAIQYWFTDKRDLALGQLMANEALLDRLNGFGDLDGIISDDDLYGDDDILTGDDDYQLGKAKKGKKKKKGFFKKIGEGIKKAGKAVAKAIVRFNPATIAARNGFLLALKTNIGKMSSRLKWAYATPQQAAAKKISTATVAKAKKALSKIEDLFEKIGGKKNNLKKAILSGKKGKLDGAEGLGILPAAAIAAATPLITAVIKIIKDSGLAKKDEQIDISATEGEAVSDEVTFDDGQANTDNTTSSPEPDPSPGLSVTDAGESNGSEQAVEGLGDIASGAVKFAQNNPLLGLAIASGAAYAVYKMFDDDDPPKEVPAPKASPELSGHKSKKDHSGPSPPVFRLH